ncbi:MAG: hypothetical protein LBK25_00230 [Treponema sp.]|jgi:hypothetical protein|nr:hypothetical protein [Treponema sp.]
MKGRDYILRTDEGSLAWLRNFIAVLLQHLTESGVPQAEVTALQAKFTDYETKLAKAKSGNRGKADVAEKNAAKKLAVNAARMITKLYLAWNPAVSDVLREMLGITVHDGTRTTIPVPQTRPEFSFKVIDLMRIQIDFHDQGSSHNAIPYGDSGALLFYATGDAPVVSYDSLTKTALLTHSHFIFELPPEDQGKILSAAMVWQNKKGEKGPWSEIQSIVIP